MPTALQPIEPSAFTLPDAPSLTEATVIWQKLNTVENQIYTIRLELAYRVEVTHGKPAAIEWLQHFTAPSTALRYLSIARNTVDSRARAIESGAWLGMNQWAAIATACKTKQSAFVTLAAEHDLPAIAIVAAIRGMSEGDVMRVVLVNRFCAAWKRIEDDEELSEKALRATRLTRRYGVER